MPGVSQKFPPEERKNVLPAVHAFGPLQGAIVNPDTGDVTVSAVAGRQLDIAALIWDALGFLDIIDQQQAAADQRAAAQDAQLAETQRELKEMQSQLQLLHANVDKLINLFGVIIPDWGDREEVENGNEFVGEFFRPSATSLGLTVEFRTLTAPGVHLDHVINISPPAGSLVQRGSTITVAIAG